MDTSEQLPPETPAASHKRRRANLVLSAITLWGLVLMTLGGFTALAALLFYQPPPATFLDVTMLTPHVSPGGTVAIAAVVSAPQDSQCLVSTQYFVQVRESQRMWKMPGWRVTTHGEVKHAIYRTIIPRDILLGPATFRVLDSYNCGIRGQRSESPSVPFVIDGDQP